MYETTRMSPPGGCLRKGPAAHRGCLNRFVPWTNPHFMVAFSGVVVDFSRHGVTVAGRRRSPGSVARGESLPEAHFFENLDIVVFFLIQGVAPLSGLLGTSVVVPAKRCSNRFRASIKHISTWRLFLDLY